MIEAPKPARKQKGLCVIVTPNHAIYPAYKPSTRHPGLCETITLNMDEAAAG
jgi:hypothetical protein